MCFFSAGQSNTMYMPNLFIYWPTAEAGERSRQNNKVVILTNNKKQTSIT